MPIILSELEPSPRVETSTASGVYLSDADEYRRNAPEILDEAGAARFLGVCTSTLRKISGVPCRVVGKTTRLYSKTNLIDWIRSGND